MGEDRLPHDTCLRPCFQHHTCCPYSTRWSCCDGSGSVLKCFTEFFKGAWPRHKVLFTCAGGKLPRPVGWMELLGRSCAFQGGPSVILSMWFLHRVPLGMRHSERGWLLHVAAANSPYPVSCSPLWPVCHLGHVQKRCQIRPQCRSQILNSRVWTNTAGASGLDWEDPLQQETVTYSSILAWRILWTEEPGGL